MTINRIEWTGDTSSVAFVFDFVGDDIDNIKFPAYLDFESENPGTLEELWGHYLDHEEEWKNNEAALSDTQIKALSVYIKCVNDWFVTERNFMLGMTPRWRINLLVDEWNPADQIGLQQLRDADDWWRTSVGEIYISDLLERVEDSLGENSYLLRRLMRFTSDELFEVLFNFYIEAGPYDYEILWFTNEDGEVDVPEDEQEIINKFLASNSFLTDFKNAWVRYHRDNPRP